MRVMQACRSVLPVLVLLCTVPQLVPAPAWAADLASDVANPVAADRWVVRAWFTDRDMVASAAARIEPWEVDHEQRFLVADVNRGEYRFLLELGFVVEVDERLTEQLRSPRPALPGQVAGIPGYPCYRTVEETYAAAQALASAHPTLASWIDVGDSWEKTEEGGAPGYDLRVLRLTNSAVPGDKPKLFLMASMHAREYTPAELATRFAEQLLSAYDSDPDVTWVLDHHEIHLLLHANPDGRKHAENGLSWRKNTNENYCSPTSVYRGADLNRNYPFKWGCCGGSSGSPCDTTYRGPAPASEPETETVRSYVVSRFPDQRGSGDGDPAPDTATGLFLDLHSYSELVLWPWGFTSSPTANSTALQTLGRKLAFFNGYTPQQSCDLYPTDGTTIDFAYGELGLASYVFEIGTSFFQGCTTFEASILPHNLDALLYAARVARTPYLTPAGPEVTAITAVPAAALQGEAVQLLATADDSRFSTANGTEPVQSIAAAAYYLDDPPWVDPGGAVPMTAADGTFDQPVEEISATLDTTTMTPGRHTLFVQAQDSAGSWGPVSAVFVWVLDPATAPAIEGFVLEAISSSPLAATLSTGTFTTATDPATGHYHLPVPAGTYDLTGEAAGHGPLTITGVQTYPSQITSQDLALYPSCPAFDDDAEGGDPGWSADAPWAVSSEAAHGGAGAWSDSPGGNYANNLDISLTSPDLDLSAWANVTLSFWHIYDLEDGWDYGYVEYSIAGGDWVTAATFNGENQTAWMHQQIALPALDGQAQAAIRFRLDTDVLITRDGWHVDDIELSGSGAVCPGTTCGLGSPVISALPFVASGDTAVSSDHFDPDACNGAIPAGAGTGPDLAYWFKVDLACTLDLLLQPQLADLTLYVVTPDCSDIEGGCLLLAETNPGGQPESLSLAATAGVDYFVIVDGNNGAAGAFDLTVSGTGCSMIPVELQSFSVD